MILVSAHPLQFYWSRGAGNLHVIHSCPQNLKIKRTFCSFLTFIDENIRIDSALKYTLQQKFSATWTIVTFLPTFCKLLWKLIIFLYKTLYWWLLIEIMMKLAPFYLSCCYNRGIGSIRDNTLILQKSQFLIFTDYSLGYIEIISCNYWSFLAILMKSHTIIPM